MFYNNFDPIRLQKCRNLENRVRVRQVRWKCHHSTERMRLPIDNYGSI